MSLNKEEQNLLDNQMSVGELDHKLVYHLWEAYSAFLSFMDARTDSPLHSLSLTQWRTLNLIYFNPGSTQSALAREIGITRASMSPIINYFEKKGLLEREPAERRNAYALSMTATGKAAIQDFYHEIEIMEQEIDKGLGTAKTAKIIKLLTELRALLDIKSADAG